MVQQVYLGHSSCRHYEAVASLPATIISTGTTSRQILFRRRSGTLRRSKCVTPPAPSTKGKRGVGLKLRLSFSIRRSFIADTKSCSYIGIFFPIMTSNACAIKHRFCQAESFRRPCFYCSSLFYLLFIADPFNPAGAPSLGAIVCSTPSRSGDKEKGREPFNRAFRILQRNDSNHVSTSGQLVMSRSYDQGIATVGISEFPDH